MNYIKWGFESRLKRLGGGSKGIKDYIKWGFESRLKHMMNIYIKGFIISNGERIEMIGYIKPTLERPAYIIEKDGKNHFIKPFIDENDKLKKFLSVVADKDGNINMVTSTILKNKDIKRIVKDGKIVKDFTNRLEAGSTELAPVPARADRSPTASNSIDKSISKEANKNKKKDENAKVLFSKSDIKENSITVLEDMRNEIEYHKLTDEEQSIYDVYMGKRSVAEIKSNDLKDVILLEKGNKKQGAKKIIVKHGGVSKTGGLSSYELVSIGKVIRKGTIEADSFSETKNSIRYGYDYKKDNNNFRVVIEEFNDGKKVIDFYSDRNFIDYGKEPSYKKGSSEATSQSRTTLLDKNIISKEANKNKKKDENFPTGKNKELKQDISPNTLYNTENNIGKKMGLLERIALQRESVGLPKDGRTVYHPTKDKNYFLSNDGRVFAEKSNGRWKETPNIDTINDIKFISERGIKDKKLLIKTI